MKNLRKLSVTLVFIFALTMPAFAGEISTGIAPPPSQPETTLTDGEISTGLTGQDETGSSEATVAGSVAEAAVNLISALSLL